MSVEQLPAEDAAPSGRYDAVIRFCKPRKRRESKNRRPALGRPAARARGARHVARAQGALRGGVWRSVVTQQLQADSVAVDMATQLLSLAPDAEARLYYTTMVQDESRHVECLAAPGRGVRRHQRARPAPRHAGPADAGGRHRRGEGVPDAGLLRAADHPALPPDRPLSAPGTMVEELCNRLATDDGIHHGAGMAYERVLLGRAFRRRPRRA